MKSAAVASLRYRPGRKEAAGPSGEEAWWHPDRGRLEEIPDWMMLDGLLRLRPMQTSDRSCASASYDSSSTGHRIIVGFRAVAAPMASALYVELCQKPGKSLPQFSEAKAVAAHRNSILLRFVFDIGERRPILEEFFVYQASPMRLIKLPACGHPLINPESNNMGIVCKEDGRDFVVAHLTVTQKETLLKVCPVSAELCCMLGSTCSWRTFKGVPISHAMSQRMDLLWWDTDTVISFGDFICWIDYLRGILFCDVSSPNPELQYVPLPVKPYKGNCHPVLDGRLEVSAYRSVCVTKDGIRFVDVSPWNIWFYGTPDFSRGLAAITSWKLSKDRSTWVEDGKMTMDEFSALIKDDNLPSTQLEFPIVDIQHPHIIYCAVRGQSDYRSKAQAFILAVDLSKKTVGKPVPYTVKTLCSRGLDSFSDTSCCNLDEHKPFLPCEFSKYVRDTRSMPVVDV